MEHQSFELIDAITPAWAETVNSRLREFNRNQNPQYWEALERAEGAAQALNVLAFDAARQVIGGLIAETRLAWLKLHVLAVAHDSRHQGIGRRLIAIAEREAIRRGCQHAFTDTMDYQAPAFYQKLGYSVAGRIENWDSHGHAKLFLVKTLDPDENDSPRKGYDCLGSPSV